MNWPWNVRVTGQHIGRYGDQRLILPPDYYRAEVRIDGKWYEAGTGETWLEAFLLGLTA